MSENCKWVNFDEDGNPVICKYSENWNFLKNHKEYEFNEQFCQYCLNGQIVEKLILLRSFFNNYKERLMVR